MIDAFGERATFYRVRPLLFQARSRHVEVVSNSRNKNLERWGLRLSRALSICHSVWGQHLEGLVKARSALKCREAETSTYFCQRRKFPIGHRGVPNESPPPPRPANGAAADSGRLTHVSQSVHPSLHPRSVCPSVDRSVRLHPAPRKRSSAFHGRRGGSGGETSEEIPLRSPDPQSRSLARPLLPPSVDRTDHGEETDGRTDARTEERRDRRTSERLSERQSHCAHSRRRFAIRLPLF